MCRIIMCGSFKGGVGKTVTAFNLAYSLVEHGKKVLAVDFDSQANLTTCFGVEDVETLPVTIGHLMMDEIDEEEIPETSAYIHSRKGVDFIPSSMLLSAVDSKEYLSQAFLIDKRINSKIEQLDNLRAISRMTNRQISDMPGSPNRNTHKLEDTVIKIVELEAEIDSDIDALVDLKADITHRIKQINCPEYQLVLELRYLCFKSWEEIAMQMGYDVRHVFRLHGEALKAITDVE